MIKCKHNLGQDGFMRLKCAKGIKDGRPSFGHCVHNCGICSTTNDELEKYILELSKPTIKTKAKSLLNHGAQIAKGLTQGKALASKTEQARRLTICKSNNCNNYNADKKTCNLCGCNLKLKVKAEALWCQYWSESNE